MLSAGHHVGPYEVVSLLGVGGMGEVYRAKDTRLGRTVALKILPAEVASDTNRRQRFEQEARAAGALNHPNILAVYDVGTEDGLAYMVSELIEGESLREALRGGPLPRSRAVEIAGQVADGLAAAHDAGIVHRDLKPENIMVLRDGRAKILDFGLAKQVGGRITGSDETAFLTRTQAGAVLGTAGYMSPEQVRGEPVDHRSDIFSFGLVLHEMLTGRQPFERPTAVEAMAAILREDAPALPETVPAALREIVSHCLEKEAARRFHSARDLAFALRTLSTTSTAGVALGSVPSSSAAPRQRRRWWPAAVLALAVVLLLPAVRRIRAPEAIDLAAYHFQPLANAHDPEHDAAWSPDGKNIAYLQTIDGIPQLMVRALGAASPIQLTKITEHISRPFWAHDSTVIYYVASTGKGELWGISPAGGQAKRILEDVQAAAASPDGKSLAIWRVTVNGSQVRGGVWISSPPGAEPRRYEPAPFETPLEGHGTGLWFSPDGSSLLLSAAGVSQQLWLLPIPAGQPRRLFASMNFGFVPKAGWMPDSRHAILSFSAGTDAQPALWMADLRSEALRKLTAGTAGEDAPSLSPDGRRVVFTSVSDDYDLLELPLDGSAPRTLLANSRNMYSPSWAPGGDQLLYSTDRNGVREIWMRNVKAGVDQPVVTVRDFPPGTTRELADPVFSPDGTRFAFVRYSTNEPATTWFSHTIGGTPIRLASEYMIAPAWSPDGGSIAGLMHKEHPWQPAVVGVGADMVPHVIVGAPMCLQPLQWSPAGQWIACEERDGIAFFSPDGSKSKKLPKLESTAIAFSRDGRTIYAAGRHNGRTFVKAVDVESGAVRPIGDYPGDATISGGATYQSRLSLAPDGKSLATSAVHSTSDLWLLDGYPVPRPWWRLGF